MITKASYNFRRWIAILIFFFLATRLSAQSKSTIEYIKEMVRTNNYGYLDTLKFEEVLSGFENSFEDNLLLIAVEEKDERMIEYLIRRGVPTSYCNDGPGALQQSVLNIPIRRNDFSLFTLLLNLGVKPIVDSNNGTPTTLLRCDDDSKIEFVKRLCSLYTDPLKEYGDKGNDGSFWKTSYLDFVVKNEDTKAIAEYLIAKYPDKLNQLYYSVHNYNSVGLFIDNYTALDAAINPEVSSLIKSYGGESVIKYVGSIYLRAARQAFVVQRLRLRAEPNVVSEIISILDAGSTVKIIRTTTLEDTIDGITAPWFMVIDEREIIGWVFGGYIKI